MSMLRPRHPVHTLVVPVLAGAVGLGLGTLPAQAVTAPGSSASGHARPGGQSAGDSLFPTIGNTGYRVRHYGIDLRYLDGGSIRATTRVRMLATHRLSSFSLDLEGLRVTRVRVDGHRAASRRHDDKLVVTPRSPVSGRFTTTVDYAGRPTTHIDPDGSQDGWVPTRDGGATALNEPVGASTWYPCNNTPSDKATFRIRVSAPSRFKVASNGDLVRRARHGGSTTWTWAQHRQMATYLAMVSIGRYRLYHSTMRTTTGRRLPVWSFVDPSLGALAHQRALVGRAIRFEERRFGPYPQTSAGIVVKRIGVGYALETQNRPFFDGTPDDSTVVHELAHQWYGDAVTPAHWEDIWLNEGFASYAEDLWSAAHGGPSTAAAFAKRYAENPASSSLWRPAPADFTDPADLFGNPVYTRGGMTLQALRARIGSYDLFEVLRRWARSERGRSVSTAQFVALAEHVSGRDLGPFFHAWLYRAAKPAGY